MLGTHRAIWCLVAAAGVFLLAALVFRGPGAEPYEGSEKVCWTECADGWAPRPPGALALSPQRLSPWRACQRKCAGLPLRQTKVAPGHRPPQCPKGWRGVYNQNTAEWACTDAPLAAQAKRGYTLSRPS